MVTSQDFGFSYWLGQAEIKATHIYVEIEMEMKRQMPKKARAPGVEKPLPWQKHGILQLLNALGKAPQLYAVNPVREHSSLTGFTG